MRFGGSFSGGLIFFFFNLLIYLFIYILFYFLFFLGGSYYRNFTVAHVMKGLCFLSGILPLLYGLRINAEFE